MIEGAIIIDKKGIVQAANQAVNDLFGYSETELIGSNVKVLMPQHYADNHDDYISHYNKTNKAKILDIGREVEGRHKSGDVFPINLKVRKVELDDTPFYLGVIHSLHKQKKAADKLWLQNELLERAEAIAHLGHWRVDLINNTLFWSKEIYRIHGVAPESFTPDVGSAINFYHPDDRELVSTLLTDAIENNNQFTFEARIVRPDGKITHVRSSGECTHDASGNPTAVFGVFLDITQIKETETALIKANEELEEFAYRTSHDLRSPLISSASLISIAKKEIQNGNVENGIECLDLVEKSLSDLNVLVRDILTLTQSQKQDEQLQEIEVHSFISEAIGKMSHIENFDRLDVQIELPTKLRITSQPNRFRLIVENLISNAIKYQDTEQQDSTIKIIGKIEENSIQLEFQDNGLGVPEQHQKKLFEMFMRFHARVSYGSGLGLYMVKKSTDLIGGSIQFTPLSKGSCFRLSLPLESKKKDPKDET